MTPEERIENLRAALESVRDTLAKGVPGPDDQADVWWLDLEEGIRAALEADDARALGLRA